MKAPSGHLNSLVWWLHYSPCLATMIWGSSFMFSKREQLLECRIPQQIWWSSAIVPLYSLFWLNLAAHLTCLALQAIEYHLQTLFFQSFLAVLHSRRACEMLLAAVPEIWHGTVTPSSTGFDLLAIILLRLSTRISWLTFQEQLNLSKRSLKLAARYLGSKWLEFKLTTAIHTRGHKLLTSRMRRCYHSMKNWFAIKRY